MNTKEAVLALKIDCKVRSINWYKGEYIELETSTGMLLDEKKLVHLALYELIECYDPNQEWELFNDDSRSTISNENRMQD